MKFFDNNYINDFLESGWHFSDATLDKKTRFQMLNITLALFMITLMYGVISNSFKGYTFLSYLEFSLLTFDLVALELLRRSKKYFDTIAFYINVQFMVLFSSLMLLPAISDLKHSWIYTFPVIVFFFQGRQKGVLWILTLMLVVVLTKVQTFHPSQYSYDQIFFILFVLSMISTLIYFYQFKMDHDNHIILQQKELLKNFNDQLENTIELKTKELKELNISLEDKVSAKVALITQKDAILINQSRQATMGEMLSMIAHQWRQPLSTMTLQIAHLKFKSELTGVTQEQVQDTLDKISDMAVYLADTIDDFQNFFKPNKDKEEISIKKLSEQAINFATPRLKMFDINITHFCIDDEIIKTHTNEVTQVIINLLNNATDQLIEQKIKNKKIKVTTKLDHELLTISIEDNGGGIKEENIEKIFDPYFSTKKKNGTGIGLYMGKMIIENELGGTLTASNSDEGAKFTIALNRNSIHLQEDEHA